MANKRKWLDHKRNFTAGEVDEILNEKVDFPRYINGCHELLNMVVYPQGPVSRRSGLEFVYELNLLGVDIAVKPRMEPFVFSKNQSYALVFFKHTTGTTRVCFLTDTGLVESTTPGVPYVYEFTGTMDFTEFDYAQSNDVIYIAQAGRTIVKFTRTAHNSWAATEPTYTDMPTGAAGWSAPDNWPTKVGFYEQRIGYAATKNRPQTIWFSESGEFETMTAGTAASDALTLTFNSGTQNSIEWMIPSRALMVGTLGDEWTVSGKGLEPLSFESFSMIRHTTQGSETIKPILIGPVVIFVERLGKVVNQFKFNYATDSYDVTDLSILAPHLTDNNKITGWAYQKTPNGVIWAIRDDGIGLGLTLKREHNVVGWHRHVTDGKFLDFCCTPGNTETDLFACVERTVGGSTKWYLEVKKPQFTGNDPKYCSYLDSHKVYEGDYAETLLGLDHLEGREVSILVNGKMYPTTPVVSGGAITLASGTMDATDNRVVVGLPFTSRVVPTPGIVPHDDGASSGRFHEIFGCNVSVYKSSGFYIGIQDMYKRESLRYTSFWKHSQDPTQATPLYTGYKWVKLPDTSADPQAAGIRRVVMEQRSALPMTILGLIDYVYTPE